MLERRVWTVGWDIDKAITQPKRVLASFDAIWEKWRATAEPLGITRTLLINRIRTLGWSEEEAATTTKGMARKRGKWTAEEIAIAEKNGIAGNSMTLVSVRISQLGWSRERALNTPRMTQAERAVRVAEGTRAYHERRKKDGYWETI